MIGWVPHFEALAGQQWDGTHPSERLTTFMARIARSLGYDLERLRRPDRRPHLVKARAIVMSEAYNTLDCSLTEIGRVLNRDHSTVHHAIASLEPLAGDRPLGKVAT